MFTKYVTLLLQKAELRIVSLKVKLIKETYFTDTQVEFTHLKDAFKMLDLQFKMEKHRDTLT